MKSLKKIGALVLALMLVCALAAPAFAANNVTLPKSSTAPAPAVVNDDIGTITFNVYLNDQKPDAAARPVTQFSYSAADGTTDASKGIIGGAASDITFTSAVTDAWNAANGPASDTITVTVGGLDTKSAGIYRYVIKQAALSAEQTGLGMTAVGADDTSGEVIKYLDVYVTSAHKIAGVVLSDGAFTTTTTSGKTENVYSAKTDGFYNELGDNTTPSDPTNTDPSDPQNTTGYTVTITKEVKGNMASTAEDFPFTLKLTSATPATADANTTVEGQTVYARTTNATDQAGTVFTNAANTAGVKYATITLAAEGSDSVELSFNLKAGETLTLTGLPATLAVYVKETVDAANGYKISAKVTDMASSAAIESAKFDVNDGADSTTNTETGYTTTGVVQADTTVTGAITYRNYRNEISPTGVVLRFAPFVIMMGAAIVLLASRRRKAEEC